MKMGSIKVGKAALLAMALLIALAGCDQGSSGNNRNADKNGANTASTTEQATAYQAGTYTGTGEGHNGPVKVEVTFSESEITDIKIVEQNETADIAKGAIEKLPATIVENQSLAVDAMSGATAVSEAILTAVADAVQQAGGDVEALKSKTIVKQGVDEEITTQIVVVGGGASGTAAALKATELGAQVVVVETTASPMGQATMAGGLFATDSSQQKAQGKTVDPSWYYNEYLVTGNYQINGSLMSRVIRNSGHVVDWLEGNGGKFTLALPGTGGVYEHTYTQPTSTLHGYTEGGLATVTKLHQSIMDKGGQVLYNTKATELIQENGHVVGIKAEKEDGGILTIKAEKVILATGGFGGNEEIVKQTFGEGFGQSRVATNIGTGIAMAIDAGADAGYDKAITMHYGVGREGTNWGTALNSALSNPYLYVDVDGNRFMNEEAFAFEAIKSSNVVKSLPKQTAYELFDQTLIDTVKEKGYAGITDLFAGELAENPTKFIEAGHEVDTSERYKQSHTPTDVTEDIAKLVAEGKIIKADSVEEMAEKLGMTSLSDTVKRYNELCAQGVDTDHFKSARYLDDLQGSIYAVKVTPSIFLGTLGGVEVNDRLQVLNKEGKAIDGLYAVGSDASGPYSDSYVYFEGGTLGFAYGSGYLAGEHAATSLKAE